MRRIRRPDDNSRGKEQNVREDSSAGREPETARAELLSKDTVFGLEIVDHLALLLVNPAG